MAHAFPYEAQKGNSRLKPQSVLIKSQHYELCLVHAQTMICAFKFPLFLCARRSGGKSFPYVRRRKRNSVSSRNNPPL